MYVHALCCSQMYMKYSQDNILEEIFGTQDDLIQQGTHKYSFPKIKLGTFDSRISTDITRIIRMS